MKLLIFTAALLFSVPSHALMLSCEAAASRADGTKVIESTLFTYEVESEKFRNPKTINIGKVGKAQIGFRFWNSGDDKSYWGFQIFDINGHPDSPLAATNVDAANFPKHGQGIIYSAPQTDTFVHVWCAEKY